MTTERALADLNQPKDPELRRVSEKLILLIGRDRYAKFFGPGVEISRDGDRLEVAAGSAFQLELLQRRFGDRVESATRESISTEATVQWVIRESLAVPSAMPESEPIRFSERIRHAGAASSRRSASRFSLATLVVGRTNQLAYNSALELVSQERVAGITALFVHGPCGVGKTHLLHGAAERFRAERPGSRVRYVTGESFANEFIAAVQSRSLEAFRKRYRGVDLLCIDDVHFVAGKKATESELLHTIDALDLDGARIMLASDEHPKRIERLSQRMVSRCVSGMVVQIEAPDRELRARLASQFALRRGLSLDGGAVEAIAEACRGSARDVEGGVLRVEAFVRLSSGSGCGGGESAISASLVRRVIGEGIHVPGQRPLRVNLIVDTVCEAMGVQASDVLGNGRHRLVVLARSLCALLARKLTTRSYPEIARDLHRKNHSTIVTAAQRMQKVVDSGVSRDCGLLGERSVAEVFGLLRDEVTRRASVG